MKKIILLAAIGFMVVSVAFAGAKMQITEKDLPDLRGTWEGTLSFGAGGGASSCHAKLEIFNDTVPVKGRLTLTNVNIGTRLGLKVGTNVFELDDGQITTQGNLGWFGKVENNFLMISRLRDKKLTGWFNYRTYLEGNVILKKK